MSKYILGALLAISLLLAGKVLWDRHQLSSLNTALNEQLMVARYEIGKAHTQFGNAQDKINNLEKELKDQIKANKETLTRYGELEAELKLYKDLEPIKEVVYVEGPAIEVSSELNLMRGMLYQAITDKTLVMLESFGGTFKDHRLKINCIVEPRPNNERHIPIKVGYNLWLRLKGQLVETHTRSGAVNYYVNLFEVDKEGNTLSEFDIEEFTMMVDKPYTTKVFWWSPHLDFGGSFTLSSASDFSSAFSVGFSSSGHGLTKNDLNWRFPRLAAELAGDDIGLSLSPILWNIGQVLPLVSNIWIGPQGTIFSNGKKSLGLSLTVGL